MKNALIKTPIIIILILFVECHGDSNSDFSIIEQFSNSAVVVEGEWGSEPGEFGITIEGEVIPDMPFGPTHFAVDQYARIYIADTYNERIQIFSPEGILLQTIENIEKGMLKRIFVDSSGNLYILSSSQPGTIGIISAKDTHLTYHEMGKLVPKGYYRAIGFDDGILFINEDYRKAGTSMPDSGVIITHLKNSILNIVKLSEYGSQDRMKFAVNMDIGSDSLLLSISTANLNKLPIKIVLEKPKNKYEYWEFGFDRDNYYFALRISGNLIIYRIDMNKGLITKIPIHTTIWHGCYRRPVFGLDGSIYYMESSEDKIWIRRCNIE